VVTRSVPVGMYRYSAKYTARNNMGARAIGNRFLQCAQPVVAVATDPRSVRSQ